MNKERLLNVAKALRESKNPDKFDMTLYGWHCGTPACAMGHYAARRDLQSDFVLTPTGSLKNNAGIYVGAFEIGHHFQISLRQEDELFGCRGCGGACTAIDAAEFIEQFVADRE